MEQDFSKMLLAEAARYVDRELESRRALNAGLQQLIAFTGILLGAAFAFGARVGKADVSCAAHTLLVLFFIGAVVGLLAVLLIALFGLDPQKRALPNPEVFSYYMSSEDVDESEVRADLMDVEVEAMKNMAKGNARRAKCQRYALLALLAPLAFSAAGAITLFFSSHA